MQHPGLLLEEVKTPLAGFWDESRYLGNVAGAAGHSNFFFDTNRKRSLISKVLEFYLIMNLGHAALRSGESSSKGASGPAGPVQARNSAAAAAEALCRFTSPLSQRAVMTVCAIFIAVVHRGLIHQNVIYESVEQCAESCALVFASYGTAYDQDMRVDQMRKRAAVDPVQVSPKIVILGVKSEELKKLM